MRKINLMICLALVGTLFIFNSVFAADQAKKPADQAETQISEKNKTIPESVVLMIDKCNSGDLGRSEKWWKFDRIKITDVVSKDAKDKYIMVGGKAENWYVGGIGTYVGKDAATATMISLKVLGTGRNSGKIKVEVVEDDIGSPDVEQDDKFIPVKDDKFTSKEININWTGWRTITIPVSELVLLNPGNGDGEWNPSTENDHYGLLSFQIIVVANSAQGETNFGLKDIALVK
jgi:hypothetical protein